MTDVFADPIEGQYPEYELQEILTNENPLTGIGKEEEEPEEEETTLQGMKRELEMLKDQNERTLDHLNLIRDPTKAPLGVVDSVKRFRTYYFGVIASIVVAHAGLIAVSIVQLIVPTFTITGARALMILIVAGRILLKFLANIFLTKETFFGKLLNWIAAIADLAAILVLMFMLTTNLSFWTMLISHIIINVVTLGSLAIIYFAKLKLASLRVFWGSITTDGFCLFCLAFDADILTITPALPIYIFIPLMLLAFLWYINRVVEINEGITGSFDIFVVVNVFPTLVSSVFFGYVLVILTFQTLKTYGFDIYLFGIMVINIPSSWFSFL